MKRYNMIADEEINGKVRILSVKDYESTVGKWIKYTDHEEQHQKDLQVMVVQQAETKKLQEQNREMIKQLKRYKDLVKEYQLDDDEELLIEMEIFIEKIEGGK